MVRMIKPALLALAVFATVWLLMFLYWQSTARMPSTGDVVAWLLLLPVALLLGWWLLRRAQGGWAAGAAGASAGAAVAAASARTRPGAGDAGQADVDEAQLRVCVLASSLRTPGGASAQELAAAIADGKGAEPDPELRNGDGFPVFASRIAALEIDELREQLGDMPLAQSGAIDAAELADDRLRAIMALGETLVELLPAAQQALDAPPPDGAAKPQRAEAPVLRISLLLPEGWSEPERQLAAQWVQQLCAAESPAQAWAVDHFRSEPGVTGLALVDRVSLALHREPRQALWIVLASESALSDARVAQWEASGRLYSSKHRNGLMPGEAAAGLLLAGAADARHAGPDAVQVSRLASGQLESSADAQRGASSATLLGSLTDRLLATAGLQANAVEWVVSDADHRVTRVTELARLLQDRLPHVPFDGNNLATGAACAHMGAAADLVGLAVGCHLAGEHQQRVLVASLADPVARAAVLVGPLPAGDADPRMACAVPPGS